MNELTVKMCRNRRHLVLPYGAIPFSFRKPLILHLIEKSGLRLPRGQQLSISTPLLRIHSNFQFLVHPLLHPLLMLCRFRLLSQISYALARRVP